MVPTPPARACLWRLWPPELDRVKKQVGVQRSRAEGLEEALAGERAARAEDARVAVRHVATLNAELATERSAREMIIGQLGTAKTQLEHKRGKKRGHKKFRREAEGEVERLMAVVAHREAAGLAFIAEAWRLRAMSTKDKRRREDAESLAENADARTHTSEVARAAAQRAAEAALEDASAFKVAAMESAAAAAAAGMAHAAERKDVMTQLFSLVQAREQLLMELADLRDRHREQTHTLASTTAERDSAAVRADTIQVELGTLDALLESERKRWVEDMAGALSRATADLEAKARAGTWSSQSKAAAAMRKKAEEEALEHERLSGEVALSQEMLEEMMQVAKEKQAALEADVVELRVTVLKLEMDGGDLRDTRDALTEDLRTVRTQLDDKRTECVNVTLKHDALEKDCGQRAAHMAHLAGLLTEERAGVVATDRAVADVAAQVQSVAASVGGAAAGYEWVASRGIANARTLDGGATPGGEGAFAALVGTADAAADATLREVDGALALITRGAARVTGPLRDTAAAARLLGEDLAGVRAAKAAAEAEVARLSRALSDALSSGDKGATEYSQLAAKLAETQRAFGKTREALGKAAEALDRYDVAAGNTLNALAMQEAKEEAVVAAVEAALARLQSDVDGTPPPALPPPSAVAAAVEGDEGGGVDGQRVEIEPELGNGLELGGGVFGKIGVSVDAMRELAGEFIRTHRDTASGQDVFLHTLQTKLDVALTETDTWRSMIAVLEARVPPLEAEIRRLAALVVQKEEEVEAAGIAGIGAVDAAVAAVRSEMYPLITAADDARDDALVLRDAASADKAELYRLEREAVAARDRAVGEMEEARRVMQTALDAQAKAHVEVDDANSALAKHVRNKDRPTLEGMWTRHAPRGPGNKPIYVPMSDNLARITIFNIYVDKITADISDDRDHRATRQTLPEFTYDFYLFKFGLQEFAEMHLAGLLRAIEDGWDSDPRIALFGALCGHAKCDEDYPLACTHYTVMYLSHLLKVTAGPAPSEASSGHSAVRLEVACQLCRTLMLADWGEEALAGMEAEMGRNKSAVDGGGGGGGDGPHFMIDIDHVLTCVSGAWMARHRANAAALRQMFLGADTNGDGVLSAEEFTGMLASDGLSWLPTRQAKGLFRESLQQSMHGSRISPEVQP